MRVAIIVQEWPVDIPADAVALEVAHAWADAAPGSVVEVLVGGDGGPTTAAAWKTGATERVGGAEVIMRDGVAWLLPAGGAPRWDALGLSTALLGLASAVEPVHGAHGKFSPAMGGKEPAPKPTTRRRVVVPLGDVPPAGDAADLWGTQLPATRRALESLDIVALVGSDRPLLGFHGMSASLLDGHEGDAALATAAQEQELRWTELARTGDAVAGRESLLGPSRPSEAPGAGAAGGLAYAVHVLGARLMPAAHAVAGEVGLEAASADADLVVAVVPELTPRTVDNGLTAPVSVAAAARGVPAVVLTTAVRVGKRDLMAAGVASAHEAQPGVEGLVDGVRRVAQTWSR